MSKGHVKPSITIKAARKAALRIKKNQKPTTRAQQTKLKKRYLGKFGDGTESILDEALRITGDARPSKYGTPKDNHGLTAQLLTAYFGFEITARDICMINILQKISRDRFCATRDNLVDIAGYAQNAWVISK